MTQNVQVGVIGGSGLYQMEDLQVIEERIVETPFGLPSGPLVIGKIGNTVVAFLPRHAKGHRYMPTEINFRANIFALKLMGVEWVISVSAVGSMKEEISPGTMVIPTQFFDRTRLRERTFFGEGLIAHVGMADPVCPELSRVLYDAAVSVGAPAQYGGTYLCIEGPQFSTRAESFIYRNWGVDVIGMTNLPEAWLAREAELCYATIAMATDYDCWHESEEDVSADAVIALLKKNINVSRSIIRAALVRFPLERKCSCSNALAGSFITDPDVIPESTLKKLWPLVGKYFKAPK